MLAETAAWAADQGKSMYQMLKEIYHEFGFYKEKLLSVTKKGKAGAEEIKAMMERFRSNPPLAIAGSKLVELKDYKLGVSRSLKDGTEKPIHLPKSDVLQFFTEDGSKISVRPSGTEPKIKFYFGIKSQLADINDFDKVDAMLENRINDVIKSLEI